MDEEQGLASPLAGGIRAVRSTVSSSIFSGRQAPVQAQPDPQVTNLLNQNSLALNNVSAQLTNISSQVAGLNGSLAAIRENLAVSDTLERQREAAKRNREAILAEQGLREGKESQIESRIQNALTFPVRRLAQKTQFGLARLGDFLLILAGGWLTNTVVNMINANADGNIDLLNQLKGTLTKQLLIIGGTMVAFSLGFKTILSGIGSLAQSALRLGRGGLLRQPFNAIATGLRLGTLAYVSGQIAPQFDNPVADFASQVGTFFVLNRTLDFLTEKFNSFFGIKGAQKTGEVVTKKVTQTATKTAVKTGAKLGFKGLLRKVAAPFRGRGGFIGAFLIDVLLFNESIDRALVGAAGFLAGVKAGAAIGGAIGALFGGVGAAPGAFIGGLIGGFLGPDVFKGIYDGIKRLFGFKVKGDEDPDKQLTIGDGLDELGAEDVTVGMRRGGKVLGPSINRDVVPAMLTPGEFVMTKETTDRIGASFFEALNKGGMVDQSITPVNKMALNNVAEKVSNLEEGAPEIINFPIAGAGSGTDTTSDGSSGDSTNKLPNIGFDRNNIHTMYATSQYGANA